jgi:hypothetical protein
MAPDSIRRSMEHSQATSPAITEQPPAREGSAAGTAGVSDESPAGASQGTPGKPGFGARGRMRRRARFLRKARELAYRDLGGLVYSLHRFGQRNDALVLAKLETIARIDNELRGLESALAEHQPVTVLREAGVAACPRCAAIHGSDDRFCPNCGLAMDPGAERPVASAAVPTPVQAPTSPSGAPAAQPGPAFTAPGHASPPFTAPTQASPPFAAAAPTAPPSTAPAQTGHAFAAPKPAVSSSARPPSAPPSSAQPSAAPTGSEPSRPRATPAPAKPAGTSEKPTATSPTATSEKTAAKGARERAATSVDESTEIIRPPIESS